MTNKSMASVGRWGSALIPTVIVGASALTKFVDPETWIENFEAWGYPGWFSYVIGVLELLGAAMIMWPRTRFYGGALIFGIMFGSMITHLVHAEYAAIIVNVLVMFFSGFSAWWYRPVWFNDAIERLRPGPKS